MSFQIGNASLPSVTGKERIILNSITESNMLILNSSLSNTNILYATNNINRFLLGNENTQFWLKEFDNGGTTLCNIFSFGSNESVCYTPFDFKGGVSVGGNFTVGGSLDIDNINTKSILIKCGGGNNANSNVPVFSVSNTDTGDEMVRMTQRGVLTTLGSIGIGTTFPLESLHVENNMYVSRNINSMEIYTDVLHDRNGFHTIDFTDNTKVTLNSPQGLRVEGGLEVIGPLTRLSDSVTNLSVTGQLDSKTITLSNTTSTQPTIQLYHSNINTSNMAQFGLLDFYGNITTTNVIDEKGNIGVGSTQPIAGIDVYSTNTTPNTAFPLYIHNATNKNFVAVDFSGNLGIGTAAPKANLHVNVSSTQAVATYPLLMLEQEAPNITGRPLARIRTNNTDNITITKYGTLAIGKPPASDFSDFPLDVSKGRIENLTLSNLKGFPTTTPNLNVVAFDKDTHLCNVPFIYGSNMHISNLTTASLAVTDSLTTKELIITGLRVDSVSVPSITEMTLSSAWITASNVLFSPNRAQLQQTYSDGRVRIYADPTPLLPNINPSTVVGMHVFGPANTSMQISSDSKEAMLRLSSGLTTANALVDIAIDANKAFRIGHSKSTVMPLTITPPAGAITNTTMSLMQNMYITSTGTTGIGITSPQYPLHVKSASAAGGTVFVEGRLGISDINNPFVPAYNLDVKGTSHFTNQMNIDTTLRVDGSVCIGVASTTTPNKLHIENGDIKHVNGVIYTPTVGIGTTTITAGKKLCVNGDAEFQSAVTVKGLMTTEGNIASVSDRRVKTNLQNITDATDKICKLSGYVYDRIDTGAHECGLMAQAVREVMPELVIEKEDKLAIAYQNMAGYFVEAIKEMRARIDSLEVQLQSSRS